MTANFIDSRRGVCGARFRSASMPQFTPEFTPEFEVRLAGGRPSRGVYMRRRLLVGLALVTLVVVCVAIGGRARWVLADRGGVPASTPAIRPAATPAAPPDYVVQPGDTLWSIAGRLRGQSSMADYVDRLVSSNGGASVQVGQVLTLP